MRVPPYALTRLTGPTIHWSRSIAWMPWFMTAPPPSSFHVPRQLTSS
jgi:hypothetical protein